MGSLYLAGKKLIEWMNESHLVPLQVMSAAIFSSISQKSKTLLLRDQKAVRKLEMNWSLESDEGRNCNRNKILALYNLRDYMFQTREERWHWNIDTCEAWQYRRAQAHLNASNAEMLSETSAEEMFQHFTTVYSWLMTIYQLSKTTSATS